MRMYKYSILCIRKIHVLPTYVTNKKARSISGRNKSKASRKKKQLKPNCSYRSLWILINVCAAAASGGGGGRGEHYGHTIKTASHAQSTATGQKAFGPTTTTSVAKKSHWQRCNNAGKASASHPFLGQFRHEPH